MKEIQLADEKRCLTGGEYCGDWGVDVLDSPSYCERYSQKLKEDNDEAPLRCAQCRKEGPEGVFKSWR